MQFAIKSNFDTIFKSYEVNNEDNHIGKLEVNEICGDCISKAWTICTLNYLSPYVHRA